MLNKILGTATLIVVAWLSIQLLQTRQILRGVQLQVSSVSAEVREDLESTADDSARLNKDVMSQLGEMQAAQSALSKQVAQAKQSQGGDPKKLKAPSERRGKGCRVAVEHQNTNLEVKRQDQRQ